MLYVIISQNNNEIGVLGVFTSEVEADRIVTDLNDNLSEDDKSLEYYYYIVEWMDTLYSDRDVCINGVEE